MAYGYRLRPKRPVLRIIRIVVLKQTELRYYNSACWLLPILLYLYYDNVYIINDGRV